MKRTRPAVTLVVDGREVTAPEGTMLVDAAKQGDVEIPVFCYEPKLGEPVGACRMCLVEIEGMPKLQTACSTPVRDGMVVYTQTDQVKEAQNAVVEFLLVNHPLDCPVCDKGGECPLQDIAMGWGPGRSRMTDPKRHFQKPLELSPLVAIDRERCILCYRCVRFSQEVAEDEQLQLLERGDRSFVGTFDERPYIAPFHGNIIELCPVGALTSYTYRFRARPWDIEQAGSVCTLCPSQCNVKFTVRDEHVLRVLARDNNEVDDGWLCDKGRFGFQMFDCRGPDRADGAPRRRPPTRELGRGDRRRRRRAAGRGERTAAIVGGGTSNEEGWLVQRIVRGPRRQQSTSSSARAARPRRAAPARPPRAERAAMADLDYAGAILVIGTDPLHEMPILDLRIRKAVRRNGPAARVASERPTALDGGAEAAVRYAPGEAAALPRRPRRRARRRRRRRPSDADAASARSPARRPRPDRDRLGRAPVARRRARPPALLDVARPSACPPRRLRPARGPRGAERPRPARGRLHCPAPAPGFPGTSRRPRRRRDQGGSRVGRARRPRSSSTPTRSATSPTAAGWKRRCARATSSSPSRCSTTSRPSTPTSSSRPNPTPRRRAPSPTPTAASSACARTSPTPATSAPAGGSSSNSLRPSAHETGIDTPPRRFDELAAEVPSTAASTYEEIGGTGIRWQERKQASGPEAARERPRPPIDGAADPPRRPPPPRGRVAEAGDPAPADADGLDARHLPRPLGHRGHRAQPGAAVPDARPALELAPDGRRAPRASTTATRSPCAATATSVEAKVAIRERMRPGAALPDRGHGEDNGNAAGGAELVEVRPVEGSGRVTLPLAEVGFAEATWILVVKSIVIFPSSSRSCRC